MKTNHGGIYRKYFKRPLDILLSLCAIIVLSPVLVIVALLVRTKLGRPIIFKQLRLGKNERVFSIYKFRTMNSKIDENGKLLPDSERLTKFGLLMRSSSLDELPSLWNILKGDMSIVGPRPLPIVYQPYFNDIEKGRHKVRGGLTGLAQINGRNSLSWESKFMYDLEYIQNISLKDDMTIIFLTVKKVINRENVGIRGVDTTNDFDLYRKKQLG